MSEFSPLVICLCLCPRANPDRSTEDTAVSSNTVPKAPSVDAPCVQSSIIDNLPLFLQTASTGWINTRRMLKFSTLQVSIRPAGFAVVELARPDKANAISIEMWDEIPKVRSLVGA